MGKTKLQKASNFDCFEWGIFKGQQSEHVMHSIHLSSLTIFFHSSFCKSLLKENYSKMGKRKATFNNVLQLSSTPRGCHNYNELGQNFLGYDIP